MPPTSDGPTRRDAWEYLRLTGSPSVAALTFGQAKRQYGRHLLALAANADPFWHEALRAVRWRAAEEARWADYTPNPPQEP